MKTGLRTSALPKDDCALRSWLGRERAERVLLAAYVVVGVAVAPGSAEAATEVNTCGQVFSGDGFLSADLDCSGFAGSAVVIAKGTLDLKGFTISSGQVHGVVCQSKCTITGAGGSILGAAVDGIRNAGRKLWVRDVTIEGSGENGIGAPESWSEVRRSRVTWKAR